MDPNVSHVLNKANTSMQEDVLNRFDPRPETGYSIIIHIAIFYCYYYDYYYDYYYYNYDYYYEYYDYDYYPRYIRVPRCQNRNDFRTNYPNS